MKFSFPPGEEGVERRWIAHGLHCLVARGLSTNNGYVLVPLEHPDFGRSTDMDVVIHGGLTFAGQYEEGTWFGFDTAHVGDGPAEWASREYREMALLRGPGHSWSVDEVAVEVERLAAQLAAREEPLTLTELQSPRFAAISEDLKHALAVAADALLEAGLIDEVDAVRLLPISRQLVFQHVVPLDGAQPRAAALKKFWQRAQLGHVVPFGRER